MKIKMRKGEAIKRLERLNGKEWDTMEIEDQFLILRKEGYAVKPHYELIKKYPKMISKFDYDFVRRLIEDAN